MSPAVTVELRAYVEAILTERDKAIAAAFSASEKALRLHSVEVERRLDLLNHDAERARQNWERTLPREVFAQYQKEMDAWREAVDKHKTAATSIIAFLLATIPIAIAVGVLVLRARG